MNKKTAFHILIVFFTAFLFRTPSFTVPYYNIDELTNGLFANFILDGEMGLKDFIGNTYILTHYVYVLVFKIAGRHNLLAIHVFHALWVGMTAIALYFASRELTRSPKGGLVAGIGYGLFSVAFFSKDYQAAIAESFSLLPASLAGWAFFKALHSQKQRYFIICGFFIGLAALFKAPAGILIVPVVLSLFIGVKPCTRSVVLSLLGLAFALLAPYFFYEGFPESLIQTARNLLVIRNQYIQAYDQLPFLHWFAKYVMRTIFIVLAAIPLWFFAFKAVRHILIKKEDNDGVMRLSILFLFLWLLCDWYVVSLGKRVFFHYFIFLFPPVCLLASHTLATRNYPRKLFFRFMPPKSYGYLLIIGVLSIIGFTADAFFRWSLKDKDLTAVIQEVKNSTGPNDRIYVWGLLPQIYFYSERKPASTLIWADSLAGFSTGSPAMEYMRATGQRLDLSDSVLKDLKASESMPRSTDPLEKDAVHELTERELLTLNEIVDLIDPPLWRDLFRDFLRHPPVLFLDTSPTGIRGFSNYPVRKYDLLIKFLEDNYDYEKTVDGIMFYRLRSSLS